MPRTYEPGRPVSSRLLDVLFAFRPGHSRLTLADLTRHPGMPHATVRRLALGLVHAGALDRAPDGSFTVVIRLWELGTLAPLTAPLRTVALPFMDDLHAALRQHVQLAVLDSTEAVLVERLSTAETAGVISAAGISCLSCSIQGLGPRAAPGLGSVCSVAVRAGKRVNRDGLRGV